MYSNFDFAASRQCALTCRAVYYGLRQTFRGEVRDGTFCDDTSTDKVCIQGRCIVSNWSIVLKLKMTNQPRVSGFEVDGQISTHQQAYLICKQLN